MELLNPWFRFFLALLATWRVTHLLANEDGPADVIVRVRVWLGERWIGKLMDCFNCLSLWIAAPMALFVSRSLAGWFFSWLALSGGACLLQQIREDPIVVEPVSTLEQGESDYVLWKQTRDDSDGEPGGAGHRRPGNQDAHWSRVANRSSLH